MQRERRREYFSLKLFYLALLLLVHIILVPLSIISVWAVHFDHPVNYHISKKKWKNLDEKIIFICYLKCSPFSSFLTIHQLILRIDCIWILIATNEVGHPTKGIPRCSKLTTIHDTRMARIENGTSIKCCRSKDMIKINILNQIESIPLKSLCWC